MKKNEALETLIDAIIKSREIDHQSELESFELYLEKMKMSLSGDSGKFKKRLLNGYQAIIKELESS